MHSTRHPGLKWTRASLFLLLVLLLCRAADAHAAADGVVNGIVRDELLKPIKGAQVVLHDARGAKVGQARTAEDGSFTFSGVPFGDYTVEANAPGRVEGHEHVQISSTEAAQVEIYCVSQESNSVIIEEPDVAAPQRSVGSVATLSRRALKELPQGEDRSITEVITTQPGFVLDAFGNVYARGSHANIQYQVDGIPIPDSVGNLFAQALPVRLIENLEILTGGIPAEFGDRLAAVVNISTRHGGAEPDGLAQVRYGSFQTIEPSVYYSRSFGKVGLFVGGSYLQSQRALDSPAVAPILHDDGRSGRAFLRFDWTLGAADRLEVFVSYAHNFFQIPFDPTVVPLDPIHPLLIRPLDAFGNRSPPYIPHDTNATETEDEVFVTASWVHTFGKRGQLQVAPYYKLSAGALASDATYALGLLADPGTTASDVNRRADHLGGVLHYSLHLGGHLLKVGAQMDGLIGATDYALHVRDDVSGHGGVDAKLGGAGTDRTSAVLSGAYLQDRWDRGRFGMNAGVRVDELHVALAGGQSDDQVGVSPRMGASFAFKEDLVGHLFCGINWQPPAPLDAANAARVLGVVPATVAVTYDVQAETDLYGEAGLDVRILKKLKLGAVGWGRYAWNQLDDIAIGATNLIANYNFERGRAVGAEGKLDLVYKDWLSAFANVSWEIAQGQGVASAKYLFTAAQLADPSWQTLDHAQTLTANLGATLRHGGAAFSTLFSYGSGLRTGPANDQTVPQHLRVDATLQYAFDNVPLRPMVAVDVINLFDAHYAFRIANGFVGSSYAAPRTMFVRLSVPLSGGRP